MAKPGEIKDDKSAQEQKNGISAKEAELAEREAQLAIGEAELAKNLKNLNMFKSNAGRDFDATSVNSGSAFTLSEIKGHGPDPGIDVDIKFNEIALEKFMHELVTINVYPDGLSGALDVVTPTVNGVNQPIIRGFDQLIKRKYVEALAWSRNTNYQQSVADQSRPENISMKPLTSITYPFIIREDRNPKGREWLEGILRQPM